MLFIWNLFSNWNQRLCTFYHIFQLTKLLATTCGIIFFRVVFPSTFILLNIMYWLIFGDILETIKDETGIGGGGH